MIVVTTVAATGVFGGGATLHGSATGLSESEWATGRGFEWGTVPGGPYEWSYVEYAVWDSDMSWSYALVGLAPGTYYFIAGLYTDTEIITWQIVSSRANTHGTIDPLGAVIVDNGHDQEFEVIADVVGPYAVTRIQIDGAFINMETDPSWVGIKNDMEEYFISGVYIFSNVVADHTIKAYFGMNG